MSGADPAGVAPDAPAGATRAASAAAEDSAAPGTDALTRLARGDDPRRFGPEWTRLRGYLARVGVGPEGSRSLTREQARDALAIILAGHSTTTQAAAFLLAMRLKRETLEENEGFLEALRAASASERVEVPLLCDLADPYDGGLRYLHVTTFAPAVLAACGLPTVVHGAWGIPPKWGLGHARVLAAAGAPVALTAAEAARTLERADVGWAYLDQREACPAMHALLTMRVDLAKRPALATLEKLVGPLRARGRTLLVSGYVHHGYEDLMAAVAREPGGFDAALVLHGLEGWCELPLDRPATTVAFADGGAPARVERTLADVGLGEGAGAEAGSAGAAGGDATASRAGTTGAGAVGTGAVGAGTASAGVGAGAVGGEARTAGGLGWKGAAGRGPANLAREAAGDGDGGAPGAGGAADGDLVPPFDEGLLTRAAAETLRAGRAVLAGTDGAPRAMLLYTCALALHAAGVASTPAAGARLAAAALDDGRAAARFEAYVRSAGGAGA